MKLRPLARFVLLSGLPVFALGFKVGCAWMADAEAAPGVRLVVEVVR